MAARAAGMAHTVLRHRVGFARLAATCRFSAVRGAAGALGRRGIASDPLQPPEVADLPYSNPLPREVPAGCVLRYQHRARTSIYHPDERPWNRGITVAVIGASGNMGRQIAMCIAGNRKNFASIGSFTLQLVGRREGASLSTLVGLCTELRDAFDDYGPHLEVVTDLDAVRADIIIMAAGANLTAKYKSPEEVTHANSEIYDTHARSLKEHNQDSLVICCSNPAEAGVDSFVEHGWKPNRVFGASSHIDTLRFRREIASELHVPRQHVTGLVLGMHGLGMVPCWSTVNLSPVISNPTKREKLEQMKEEGMQRIPMDVEKLRDLSIKVRNLTMEDHALKAASIVSRQPADMRAILRRYVSFFSGPIYPRIGTGEKVAGMITHMLNGRSMVTAAAVHLQGDFLGFEGHAIGAPVIISSAGVQVNEAVKLAPREVEAIKHQYEEATNLAQALQLIRRVRLKKRTTSKGAGGKKA